MQNAKRQMQNAEPDDNAERDRLRPLDP